MGQKKNRKKSNGAFLVKIAKKNVYKNVNEKK